VLKDFSNERSLGLPSHWRRPSRAAAAIYLGRFRRRVAVVDAGWSRAKWISSSHNLPGFPGGLDGTVLLERMREQAWLYGATQQEGYVDALIRAETGVFTAVVGSVLTDARTIILATGVVENKPPLPHLADAVKRGLIRTCPICDGYESIDKTVAVIGNGEHAAAEALFLRTYTDRLTLLMAGGMTTLSTETARRLAEAAISVTTIRGGSVRVQGDGLTAISSADGQLLRFDVAYSAFGITPQTVLALSLGARLDTDGRLEVNAHQETSVEGLFAAGDLVKGLNLISVADGEAAVAATAVHNSLPKVPA
jgi:thioredoxin reductase (NADPH)